MAATSVNRINIVVPGSSSTAGSMRDTFVNRLVAMLGAPAVDLYRYSDTNSGLGSWSYLAVGYGWTNGIATVATVSCSGMAHPPSGSNLAAAADPGPGTTYTWYLHGGMPRIFTSDVGAGSGSAPTQNNNVWVWNIPANSSAAANDFTNAINKIMSDTALGSGYWSYLKYVDSVSGAWAVYALAIFMGSLPAPVTYLVTCAGTPNPPTGSPMAAVSIPAFTQTFTPITAPLSFGPAR